MRTHKSLDRMHRTIASLSTISSGSRERFGWSSVFLLVLIFLGSTQAFAQFAGKGSILGVVSDTSGAVIPDATVTATNVATGTVEMRKTSGTGYYNISPLEAGEYVVQVSAAGFATIKQEHIRVDALAQVGLNLTLQPGEASQTITVTAAPPLLDTASAALDTTIDNQSYANLPLQMNGGPRDPTKFITLVPGVTIANSSSQYSTSIFSGTGSQGRLEEVYYDGMPVTSIYIQGDSRSVSNTISVEAVDQIQVVTSVIPAQYQGAGLQNYTIKSGGNKYHGSVFEYFRNTSLDTWGYFTPYTNINAVTGKASKPTEHQNEYGVSLSGPILRNKLFLFGSYDGYRYSQSGNPTYNTIPTLTERQGDFSAYSTPIYDPTSTVCTNGVCSRTPISYNGTPNVMNPSLISPVASKLQSLLPNPTNGNLTSNYLNAVPNRLATFNTTNKVDYQLNQNHRVSVVVAASRQGTLGYQSYGTVVPPPYLTGYWWASKNKSLILEENYVISPRIVNALRYGFFRFWGPVGNPDEGSNYGLGKLGGLTNLPAGQATNAFPDTYFSDPNRSLSQWAGGYAYNSITNAFNLQDDIQYNRGRHSFTFGVLHQWLEVNNKAWSGGGTSPVFLYFNNAQTAGYNSTGTLLTSTGNAYASFLTGQVQTAYLYDYSAYGTTGGRQRPTSLYAQDDLKVNPKLTVNIGLRWDFYPPSTEVQNRMSFLNPTLTNPTVNYAGALQFAGGGTYGCKCSTPIHNYYKNFGPRLGFAYSVNDKMVVRGGYGISYTHATGLTGISYLGTGQLGFGAIPYFTGQNGASAFALESGFPSYTPPPFINSSYGTGFSTLASASTNVNYADPVVGARAPYAETWSIGIEQMLTQNLGFQINYTGSQGHFLPVNTYGHPGRGQWANQLDPKYYSLGSLLNSAANATTVAAAAAIVPGVAMPYSTFKGTIGQMLRPFPQYNGVNDVAGNVSNSNYNALQLIVRQRLSHGLTFTLNYTHQKEIDDNGNYRSAYLSGSTERSVGTADTPNVVSFYGDYLLPFGRNGQLGNSNPIVRAIVSGWSGSWIYTYSSGRPISITGGSCLAPYSGTCYPNINPNFRGSILINGGWGHGITAKNVAVNYIDKNAFLDPSSYTFGNAPRTAPFGLRGPSNKNIDFSLKRDFALRDNVGLRFDVSAYNLTNSTIFGVGYTTYSSGVTSFGQVTGQSNQPRQLQLAARISF